MKKIINIKFTIIILIAIFLPVNLQAQTVKEILTNVQNKVIKTNFKVNLTYRLFKGIKGKKELETFKGTYIKKDKNYYNKIKNTETIIGANFLIKINHDQKALLYESFKNATPNKNNMLNIKTLLKNFEKPVLTNLRDSFKCEMVAVEYSQMPYSKIILYINKKDYSIKKQVLYLTSLINFSDDENKNDFSIPRLEIQYSNYSALTNQDKSLLKKNNYIVIINNKVRPSTKYKAYEIINTKNI